MTIVTVNAILPLDGFHLELLCPQQLQDTNQLIMAEYLCMPDCWNSARVSHQQ